MSTTQIAELVQAAGGVTVVAARMGRRIGTVSSWITRNKVPAEEARSFASAVGRTPHDVRPDIYPVAESV